MFKRTSTATRTHTATRMSDRLAYLWLALAAVLYLFIYGQWTIPLAAWLAPLFLLRYVRTQPLLAGFLTAWLARSVVGAVTEHGIILVSGVGYYGIVVLITAVSLLPYLADRLLATRLQGFVATLVFPLTFTALEYLSSFSSFGVMNSIAYTQYGDLPLMQLVSVTGIWGMTFLITWFAAVVNWAWERGFTWPKVQGGSLIYAGILAAVLVGGGARLAIAPPDATLVRVAGLSVSRGAIATYTKQLPTATLALLEAGKASPADRALARAAFATLDDDLLARSQQEARAGAKIVAWPETSPTGANILQEDEPALLQRAGALAQQEGIYLEMGLGVFLSDASPPPFLKDEVVLLDPAGQVAWTYEKYHLVPFGEVGLIVQGNGQLPLVTTPYGRLSTAIYFDQDFPATMRQAGQGGADVVLGPADDWRAIDPMHTQHAVFRAIENGYSLVHEANNGLSLTVDYEGHVLAATDYFATDNQIMVASVPTHGTRTIYATIGDLFAWLCLLGLGALIALSILQRRQRQAASATASLPESQQAG